MDEEFIKRIVHLKLDAAERLISRLPEKMSLELREMGRVILKSVNENVKEKEEHPSGKSKPSDQLNHVPIE